MRLVAEAQMVMQVLNRHDLVYGLCGGLAMAVHDSLRATIDIDILLQDDVGLAAIDPDLAQLGWLNMSEPITFDDGLTLHRRIKLQGRTALKLELLIQGVDMDLLSDRILTDFQDGMCWVVSRRALIEMKRVAGRPQDRADLDRLEGRDDGTT